MNEKSLEQAGNLFTYINQKCRCLIDIMHDENAVEHYKLKIKANPNTFYKYAYAPIDGLLMINQKSGAIIKDTKVVEDFLSMKFSDINSISTFIEKYGFFLPVSDRTFTEIPVDDITPILYRFKLLVTLMSELGKTSYNYNTLLLGALRLILQQPRRFEVASTQAIIETCPHPLTVMWYNPSNVLEKDNLVDTQTNDPYENYYLISDSFTGKDEHLDYITYNEDVGNMDTEDYDYSESHYILKKITFFYKNADFEVSEDKLIIDFIYHFNKEISRIESISPNGVLKLSKKIDLNTEPKFSEHYKKSLVTVVRRVIKEELDHALFSIRPIYNIETMSPSWEIPDLITALYFSLFYMRPNYEIYRQCANPNCNRLFRVKTTNSKQLYHDTSCQNAAAQMRHRKKSQAK